MHGKRKNKSTKKQWEMKKRDAWKTPEFAHSALMQRPGGKHKQKKMAMKEAAKQAEMARELNNVETI